MRGQRHAPATLYPHGKDLVPIVQEAGWAPGPVWTGAENLAPTGIRSPHRPAHSQSLYRLRYMYICIAPSWIHLVPNLRMHEYCLHSSIYLHGVVFIHTGTTLSLHISNECERNIWTGISDKVWKQKYCNKTCWNSPCRTIGGVSVRSSECEMGRPSTKLWKIWRSWEYLREDSKEWRRLCLAHTGPLRNVKWWWC
jgi:hypothetical protein